MAKFVGIAVGPCVWCRKPSLIVVWLLGRRHIVGECTWCESTVVLNRPIS